MTPRREESQLETYAADLSRTYAELRRHLHHMTVLHEVNTRIVSALDPDEVLAGMLDSLSQLLVYETALRLGEPLPEEDVKVIELLAAAAAVALQNAYLYQETQRLATTDPLTGLSNYRHFHDLLNLEVQRARRMDYAVGLVIMDLDHFKLVNDRHGHPMGDAALRQVAEQLRSRLRRTDVLGRLGGEEFGAILPGANLTEVSIVAEKVRRAIEELPPLSGGMTSAPTPVTLSVGGTSLAAAVVDAELLVSYADHALYQAKRNGRNQVRLWSGPSRHAEPASSGSPQRGGNT